MTNRLPYILAAALISGCATPLPSRPSECNVTLRWIIAEHPDSLCTLYGVRNKHYVLGCQTRDREGRIIIITGPVKTVKDLGTIGEEMVHACFPNLDHGPDSGFQDHHLQGRPK